LGRGGRNDRALARQSFEDLGLRLARIEDYALIGDTHSVGLVARDGSIDWLCLPRLDSGAVFAALLDDEKGGKWRIAPEGQFASTRAYRRNSMVLETTFETEDGAALLTDCLPLEEHSDPHVPRQAFPHEVIVRVVRGLSGSVAFDMRFEPRFDYGYITPWIRRVPGAVEAVGGPDALALRAEVPVRIQGAAGRARFKVAAGESVAFLASYRHSHVGPSEPLTLEHCRHLVEKTDAYWSAWASRCSYRGRWRDAVVRSLLTLKALTYSPTGGIAAAATTSLPEAIGGLRNWDYRYCWLRDATYTLDVLLELGYKAEAREWRGWLMRAVAGDPQDLQIMYGVQGERRLVEQELPWLAGYEGSRPVRVGNDAHRQFQLDVYGEVMDSFHAARTAGIPTAEPAWELETSIVDFVCEHWREPDEGIWEVRSGREHFVHSKVMAWVAVDRGIAGIERAGKPGPLARWRQVRAEIRDEVLSAGVHPERGCFVRSYGSEELDASLLMLPLVGFVEPRDLRMIATVEAIERDLVIDGFVHRYRTDRAPDGLPPGEGAFLMCTFWLAQCLVLLGRAGEAEELFERMIGLANDVGLLSEQYDPGLRRLVGNFPQAFSHTALITTAATLESEDSVAAAISRAR
jgi:GH15 family glucan-1,4-alpha-glucosidase